MTRVPKYECLECGSTFYDTEGAVECIEDDCLSEKLKVIGSKGGL